MFPAAISMYNRMEFYKIKQFIRDETAQIKPAQTAGQLMKIQYKYSASLEEFMRNILSVIHLEKQRKLEVNIQFFTEISSFKVGNSEELAEIPSEYSLLSDRIECIRKSVSLDVVESGAERLNMIKWVGRRFQVKDMDNHFTLNLNIYVKETELRKLDKGLMETQPNSLIGVFFPHKPLEIPRKSVAKCPGAESMNIGLPSNVNDTLQSSFNPSMLPPDCDATQSVLSQKSFKNSPQSSTPHKPKPLQQLMTSTGADQIQNHSFSTNATAKVEKMQRVSRALKSPLQSSPGRLPGVQLKTAQNFEDLKVCQATLKNVETEKAEVLMELSRLEDSHHRLVAELDEAKQQLEKTLVRCAAEQDARLNAEEILEETKRSVEVLKREHANKMMIEVGSLSNELGTANAEESAVRDHLERMGNEMELLRRRAREAENRVERTANEKQDMVILIASLEEKLAKAAAFEKEAADYAGKLAARKKEIEVTKKREDMVNAAIEGLGRVRKEVVELTKKTEETQIILGNASSIRLVCDELCRLLTRERELQHESAQTMKYANDNIEKLQKENLEMQSKIKESQRISKKSTTFNKKENAAPPAKVSPEEIPSTAPPSSSQKTSVTTSNFDNPTRQLLYESMMAVDSIVQKLKKTYNMSGMGEQLKDCKLDH